MNAYLNTLTVKVLKEIAKRIGFRFISRYRKAELIALIIAEIDACHIEAIREDKIRAQQAIEAEARKIEENRIMEALANHPTIRPAGIDRAMVVHYGSLINGIACPADDAQISDMDITLVTCQECISATQVTVSAGIVIAPVELQIPAMMGPYGYTAHGNTYAVDYNRVHESMTRVPFAVAANEGTEDGSKDVDFSETVSAPQPLDITSFLTDAHRTLTALTEQAIHAENEAWDRGDWSAEEWTSVAKAMRNAVADLEWSLNYRASKG